MRGARHGEMRKAYKILIAKNLNEQMGG